MLPNLLVLVPRIWKKRLVNGTTKSTSTSSAKSKHERAYSTSDQRHITIPPPASKDRGEQTSQIFDADKQHRLNSLAEGKFPDPTYPRASISNGTEISPGFNAAMGFRYSPGFGGPQGFNSGSRNQSGLALRRHSSAMFGTAGSQIGPNPVQHSSAVLETADLPSSEQAKPTGPNIPNADASPSSRINGLVDGPSPSKNTFTIPDPSSPEYLRNFSTDWNNYINCDQDRFTGQDFGGYQGHQGYQSFQPGSFGFHRSVGQSFSPYGSLFGPGNPQYYNPEILNTGNDSSWTAPQMSSFPPMSGYPPIPSFSSIPQNIEYQGSPQLEQLPQTSAENSEPLGIRESRMTREKTMFVPGGKIIKTTTTVFTPTDEEKRKGKSVESVPEDKIGIVVVDKEGNVDVESGDWLAGFNRIEGWEVEALLRESKKRRPHKNKNGPNKKGIAKKPILKKATPLKKAIVPSRKQTSIKPTTVILPNLTLKSPEAGSSREPAPPTLASDLDFIPFNLPNDHNMRSTRLRATRISKPIPQASKKIPAKKVPPGKKLPPVKKATLAKGASTSPPKTKPKASPKTPPKAPPKTTPSKAKAATQKNVRFASVNFEHSPADSKSLHISDGTKKEIVTSTSTKTKKYESKVGTKSNTTKSKAVTPKSTPPKTLSNKPKNSTPSKSKSATSISISQPKSQPKAVIHKAKARKITPKSGNTPFSGDFARNISEIESQVQRQLDLADQAAENMERRRGKDAEKAARDFETLMGLVEKGRKELDERRNMLVT
ncbi:hypothetical protein EYC84_006666 [Monilinia fructicola]|uniref:Uncharacterized protein n=1 Tax=Monilinia fructicola TaxID=38448 RepID=A0A5M9K7T1_MONFR|nr:hypothetical protein EYC84_006666 [Monilinia fructicola]